jgi:hypothetical protein
MLFPYIMEKLQQQLMFGLQMNFFHECFKGTLQHNDFLEHRNRYWFMWVIYFLLNQIFNMYIIIG